MTTIAADFKKGLMVCDSRCSDGNTWTPMTKVFRVDGELYGFAGSVAERDKWLKWHSTGRRRARPKLENFVGLALRRDGVYEINTDGLEMLIERGFHAVGSGGQAAIAVMLAGRDVKTSVEIACQVDAGSGGEIHVHNFIDA